MRPSPDHVSGRLLDSYVVGLAETDNDLPEPAPLNFLHLLPCFLLKKLQVQFDRLHINGEEENTEL